MIGFVGAAMTKSLILAAIILLTARLFVDYSIAHPFLAVIYIMLVAAAFSLFGFILGIWADSFEKLGIIPMLILTPLTFLGGTFYSIADLPARMLLQVHDELVFEVQEDAVDDLIARARGIMEGAAEPAVRLSVPLVVDAGSGANWAEAH